MEAGDYKATSGAESEWLHKEKQLVKQQLAAAAHEVESLEHRVAADDARAEAATEADVGSLHAGLDHIKVALAGRLGRLRSALSDLSQGEAKRQAQFDERLQSLAALVKTLDQSSQAALQATAASVDTLGTQEGEWNVSAMDATAVDKAELMEALKSFETFRYSLENSRAAIEKLTAKRPTIMPNPRHSAYR